MEKSSDLFGQILSHGPSQSTLFLILTKMKEEGRFREVIQECHKALGFYPDDLRLRTLLAESYLELGFIGLAELELAKVTSHLHDLVSVYKLQAEIYIQQQRDEEALDALNQYLALNPDDQNALDLLRKLEPALEEALSDVSQMDADFAEVEGEKVEDKHKLEAAEIPEDIARIRVEEVEEKPSLRAAEVTEDVVGTTSEIEQDQVLEDEEIPQALERAAQEIIEQESEQ